MSKKKLSLVATLNALPNDNSKVLLATTCLRDELQFSDLDCCNLAMCIHLKKPELAVEAILKRAQEIDGPQTKDKDKGTRKRSVRPDAAVGTRTGTRKRQAGTTPGRKVRGTKRTAKRA